MTAALDLTEAIEEAARMTYAADWATGRDAWDLLSDERKIQWRRRVGPAVFAAAPLIEQQVREDIVADPRKFLPPVGCEQP
jgi:hypothetical protein